MRPSFPFLGLGLSLSLALTAPTSGGAQDFEQRVIGPGLYVFQTRVRDATCNDDFKTGYVTSFFASIDGVPGERKLTMTLLNSPYWPTWTIEVKPSGEVTGLAKIDGKGPYASRESSFQVRRDRDRFVGRGSRSYWSQAGGQWRRCTVYVDTLLRRFDVSP